MSTTRRTRRALLALLPLAAALAIAACGGDDSGAREGAQAAGAVPAASGNGVPTALAENRAQASQLIDGSSEALEAKLADLRGHPVVVNQWGSWCPPCRAEFPFFAEIAEAHAKDVAFVGVDIQDDSGAAEDFLEELPVPYPSVVDQDTEAVQNLRWSGVSPTTWFLDERGEIVHQRPGAYPEGGALEADIQSFLLSG